MKLKKMFYVELMFDNQHKPIQILMKFRYS